MTDPIKGLAARYVCSFSLQVEASVCGLDHQVFDSLGLFLSQSGLGRSSFNASRRKQTGNKTRDAQNVVGATLQVLIGRQSCISAHLPIQRITWEMQLTELSSAITVVNSIIGVSVLTLPFCYQECGVVLGSLLLLTCSWMAYSSSMMLIEAALSANRKTYFGLAQVSFGVPGKVFVEISMIGLLLGTCIAFFAALEDLVVNLFMKLTGSSILPWQHGLLLCTITSVVVLPLSLQKKVSNSAWQSLTTIIFYILLMFVLAVNCLASALSGGLVWKKVHLWHWSGITTCLPILATSFCGHPLVLPIYFNLRGQTVEQMKGAFKHANIIVVTFYAMVGLSGYLAYSGSVPGDILAALPPSLLTDGIRAIFLVSLASSFPLIILPCRQAISTLLFEQQKEDGTFSVSGDMPFHRHVMCTVAIVFCTMVMGVLVPDVQTVLAVMGSTMASVICFIFPSAISEKLLKGNHSRRVILGMGVMLLLIWASSIANLTAVEFQQQPIRKSIVPVGKEKLHLANNTTGH